MWEAIESNRRRSRLLIALMGVILMALGFVIGFSIHPEGGPWGILAAGAAWGILWLVAVSQGDALLLASAGAVKIQKEDSPTLWNVVEEMTIASGMGKMPDVYIIQDNQPNAFAVGRKRNAQAVAVTVGLLRTLNRDELQGVIAHEIGHMRNGDVAFMTLAGVMMGAIVLLADVFLRGLRHGGRGGRHGAGPIILVTLVLAILAPILARLLYFACSRRREYLADASSARFTRYPEGLASALHKMSLHSGRAGEVNRVLAPLYIVSPGNAMASIGPFSTHPPIDERIKVLRSMGGAGYAQYEDAFRKVAGAGSRCVGDYTLAKDIPVALRGPSVDADTPVERSREAVQLAGRLAGMLTLTCSCGVGIKVPEGMNRADVPCPRCGVANIVPVVEPVAAPAGPVQYRRQGRGKWESFRCACGHTIQLSPAFSAPHTSCRKCNRSINILD